MKEIDKQKIEIPKWAIRAEFSKFSVFKRIRGIRYFIGQRDTIEEAQKLYWDENEIHS